MPQHIIALIGAFATWAKYIGVVLGGVNPQPSCGGKPPLILLADAFARLSASGTNL